MRIIYCENEKLKIVETDYIRQIIHKRETKFKIYTTEALRISALNWESKQLDYDIDFAIDFAESDKIIEEAYQTGLVDLRKYEIIID